MKIDPTIDWMSDHHPASHWEKTEGDDHVVCKLSPRNCKIREGSLGKCGVRGNVDNKLVTFNYGKSVEATMEYIETEAVYHYRPGAKILSLGNVGCMMSCDFCQNWRTSQTRHLDPRDVRRYTPEDIVEACMITGINVISWTYNDPVVWHEFVVETSRLAQAMGIATLYKSAFYIEPGAVDELIDCIDIFSISLKSMDDRFYLKFTGGTRLQPVLNMIERVHASGRHLEVSQLMITGRNDNANEIKRTNDWVLDHLGDRVPLHYVGFHPAYLYTNTTRTRPETLLMAREMAQSAGIRYCYVGNMFQSGVADSYCTGCGTCLVSRYGLQAVVKGLDASGHCTTCGAASDIRDPMGRVDSDGAPPTHGPGSTWAQFHWHDEANSVHIEVVFPDGDAACPLRVERLASAPGKPREYVLGGILKRLIVSKEADTETGIRVLAPAGATVQFFPVLDRAHFPTSTDLGRELVGYRTERACQARKSAGALSRAAAAQVTSGPRAAESAQEVDGC